MTRKFLITSAVAGFIVSGGAAAVVSGVAIAAPAMKGPMKADANGDGNLTRAELTASLDKRFAELDKDGDGKVTVEERKAVREARFAEHFKKMDKDGNGQLSMAEMQAGREARKAERGRGHHGAMHHGHHGGPGGRMGMMDADKDGIVTKVEFQSRALAKFNTADANKDGTVTKAEHEAARAQMKSMRRW